MRWWSGCEPLLTKSTILILPMADDLRPNEAVKKSQLGQVECVSEIKNFQDG
jgi:hypothetical protein